MDLEEKKLFHKLFKKLKSEMVYYIEEITSKKLSAIKEQNGYKTKAIFLLKSNLYGYRSYYSDNEQRLVDYKNLMDLYLMTDYNNNPCYFNEVVKCNANLNATDDGSNYEVILNGTRYFNLDLEQNKELDFMNKSLEARLNYIKKYFDGK